MTNGICICLSFGLFSIPHILSIMPDSDKIFVAKVNDFEFQFSQAELNGTDIVNTSCGVYHIILDSHSITASITDIGKNDKTFKVEIDGEVFEVSIRDPLDQVLDKMGFNNVSARQIKEIKAPMPGLVLDIAVAIGDQLNEGDRVLILEAMKMENSIVMQGEGKIKKVNVEKGQAVEKGQVLVELE